MTDNQESPSKELDDMSGRQAILELATNSTDEEFEAIIKNMLKYNVDKAIDAGVDAGIESMGIEYKILYKESLELKAKTLLINKQLLTMQQALDNAVEALKEYAEADHIRVHYSTNDNPVYQLKVYTSTWVKAKAALASIKEWLCLKK